MKKSPILLCVILFTVALIFPRLCLADMCPCPVDNPGNALEAFEKAEQVIIAKVVGVKKIEITDEISYETMVQPARVTVMTVEKTYKGGFNPGEEIEIVHASCSYSFDKVDKGGAVLLYLYKPLGNTPRYVASWCGRSGAVESSTEDIRYLDNISSLRGETRLSGRLMSWFDNAPNFSGSKILICQGDKKWELITDSKGVFEIYDLPAGEYEIAPEPPAGWRIDTISSSSIVHDKSKPDPKQESRLSGEPQTKIIALKEGKHASIEVRLFPDHAIRGRLLSSSGKPIANGYVRAESVNGGTLDFTQVNSNGEFEIRINIQDKCVIAAQLDGIYSYYYYPGVADREKAEVFTIKPDAFFDIEFRISGFE